MTNNILPTQRQQSRTSKLFKGFGKLSQWIVLACTLIFLSLIVIAFFAIRSVTQSHANMEIDQSIGITPTQVQSMKAIGQWEFLSIADEEMIDTTKNGFFSDDELIRIYYGTIRLGINMHKVKPHWIKKDGDTLRVTLPPIELLDEDFIDEARVQSFFESGKWNDKDREAMYQRAYTNMKERCMTSENIRSAEQNASKQFSQLMRSMGFNFVSVTFEDEKAAKDKE